MRHRTPSTSLPSIAAAPSAPGGLAGLVLCEGCDALQLSPVGSPPSRRARCFRCGATLPRSAAAFLRQSVGPAPLLVLSGMTILVLGAALTLPIMSVEGASDLVSVNVWRAVAALRAQHLAPLAALVMVTTAVFPMIELGCLCGLVACATFASASASASASRMARLVAFIRPWCQLDILCLALLIAARKLTGLYRVHAGPGLPCLGLVLLVDVVVARLVDSEPFWRRISARMAGGRVARTS